MSPTEEKITVPFERGIFASILPSTDGRTGIGLILGQLDRFQVPGHPDVSAGIHLSVAKAREIAHLLQYLAALVESGTAAVSVPQAPASLAVQ